MKTLIKIWLTQPWAYALLLVVILASFRLDTLAVVLSLLAVITFILYTFPRILKPSREKTNYTVKKGKSYCFHRPTFHTDKSMKGEFTLWDSAKYPLHTTRPKQINKITGMSWGLHHDNSLRIGVVYNQDDTFNIYAYAYSDREPIRTKIAVVKSKTKVKFDLGIRDNRYYIKLQDRNNNDIANWSVKTSVKKLWGVFLYPYQEDCEVDWCVELQYYHE